MACRHFHPCRLGQRMAYQRGHRLHRVEIDVVKVLVRGLCWRSVLLATFSVEVPVPALLVIALQGYAMMHPAHAWTVDHRPVAGNSSKHLRLEPYNKAPISKLPTDKLERFNRTMGKASIKPRTPKSSASRTRNPCSRVFPRCQLFRQLLPTCALARVPIQQP